MAPSATDKRASKPPTAAPPARGLRVSLRVKTGLLLSAVGLVPLALTASLVLDDYGRAVRIAEEHGQLATLRAVSVAVERQASLVESDTLAMANAVAYASQGSEDDDERAMKGLEALLATRTSIDAVRLEIPDASIDTVLHKEGADVGAVPRSTPELRQTAERDGIAFGLVDSTRALVVVPLPKAGDGPSGFVTAPMYLAPMQRAVRQIVESRPELAGDDAAVVIADAERRIITSTSARFAPTDDFSTDPIWGAMPDGTPSNIGFSVKAEHERDGATMVGTLQAVDGTGWVAAMWRPEAQALSEFHRLRTTLLFVGSAALLLIVAGAVVGARTITRPILRLAAQTRTIAARKWAKLAGPSERADELGDLDRAVHSMAKDLEESELEIAREAKLRGDLARFMSRELVDSIVAGKHDLQLGGERREISVLFADIVAFTPLAESKPAETVVKMLNELFSVLTEVVFRHGGVVDKFIGDCIMAVWGAPLPQADHARRALAAAEDMMRFLETVADDWRERYDVEVRLGIGINSGEAIVGNIGSDKRMEYTVIGDVVNIAARLETLAAPNQVLVAQATVDAAGSEFPCVPLGERTLTGRATKTSVFELTTD